MKLQVSNTNAPTWRDITIHAHLPEKLKSPETMAKNLWWVWNSSGKNLFRDLDHDLWRATGENPVMLLHQLSSNRIDEILASKEWMERIDGVYEEFKAYMSEPMRKDVPSVSYFSMEYGLCSC